MKKIITLLLVLVMILSIGCSKKAADQNSDSQNDASASTEKDSEESSEQEVEKVDREDAYTVTMVYPYTVEIPPGVDKVEQAMSDYCWEKLGVNFALKPVPFFGFSDQYPLWASSGEQVDLWLLIDDLQQYVDNGSAEPITQYYDAGLMPNVERINGEMEGFVDNGRIDGELYRIGVVQQTLGSSTALKLRKDVFDAIDYSDDGTGKDLYTYEDMDEIFAKVHEAFPDLIVIDKCGTKTSTSAGDFLVYDAFAQTAGGVIMGNQGTEIVNLYETDEYAEYVKKMREWYLAGYFDPDCATTAETSDEWMYAKKTATFGFTMNYPGYDEIIEPQYGLEFLSYETKRMGIGAEAYGSLGWIVSCNSENIEKAAQVLDLFYEESGTLINYLLFGVEGEHYVKTDDPVIVTFPEGMDQDHTDYYYTLGLFGDKRKNYLWYPQKSETLVRQDAFTKESLETGSEIVGYKFNTVDVQDEIAAINQVFSKYLSTLEYGLADPDETLDRFRQELKSAGIDKVIEENQKQLNEWLAAR